MRGAAPGTAEPAVREPAEAAPLDHGDGDGGALAAAARAAGVPWTLLRSLPIPPAALARLPAALARRHGLLPLGMRGGRLLVAAAGVPGLPVLDAAARSAGVHVEPCLVAAEELEAALARHYGLGAELRAATEAAGAFDPCGGARSAPGPGDAVVRLVDLLVASAVERRASDVHLEPGPGGVAVRFRVDGLLQEGPSPSRTAHRAMVTRIKVLAGLDVASSRAPQDGAFHAPAGGRPVDVRVSVLPTVHGESVVLRILDRGRGSPGLDALGLLPAERARLDGILDAPHGLVVVAGPTGSGKSTTLHAILGRLRRPGIHVVSIEDPVEYETEGVRQVQVDEAAGVTFASGLRSILRHDPDVILVGETRDPETAQLAARAALTGHLVLTTLHAPDAPSVALRLRDLGVPAGLLSSILRGVIAQRLVRRVCPACKGAGCEHCGGIGTSGRTGVFEVMPATDALRALVAGDASPAALAARAREEGMRPLFDAGLERAGRGTVPLSEVLPLREGRGPAPGSA